MSDETNDSLPLYFAQRILMNTWRTCNAQSHCPNHPGRGLGRTPGAL